MVSQEAKMRNFGRAYADGILESGEGRRTATLESFWGELIENDDEGGFREAAIAAMEGKRTSQSALDRLLEVGIVAAWERLTKGEE